MQAHLPRHPQLPRRAGKALVLAILTLAGICAAAMPAAPQSVELR